MIATKKDKFLVRFGKTGSEIRVPAKGAGESEKMEEVCEEFYRLAHEFLSTPLEQRIHDQATGTGEIGFHATD